jgi:hypothetical protein
LGRLAKARHRKANEARSRELKAMALYFHKKVTKDGDQPAMHHSYGWVIIFDAISGHDSR